MGNCSSAKRTKSTEKEENRLANCDRPCTKEEWGGDANLVEVGDIREYVTSFLWRREEDFGMIRSCAGEFQTTTAKSAYRISARSAGGERRGKGKDKAAKGADSKRKDSKGGDSKGSGSKGKIPKERKPAGKDPKGMDSEKKKNQQKDSTGAEKIPKVEEDAEAKGRLYASHTKRERTELGASKSKK